MAYGLKYYASAYGISSVEWKVELLEKDYVGSTSELGLVGTGIQIGYDREDAKFNNIYSRYANINLKATADFGLDDLQFDDERKFQVKVYKNSVVEFIGWLIPFSSSEQFEDVSLVVVTVTAKDGINQLKNTDFINEHPEIASNKQSFKDIISQALRAIGYNLPLEIYYNKYDVSMLKTASDCPLAQLYFNVTAFYNEDNTYINYYEALGRLLETHNLRISQVRGKWVIVSAIELEDGSVAGRAYNYLGVSTGNVTLNSDFVIHTSGPKVKTNAQIRKDIPYQQFSSFYQVGQFTNLLANGNLTNYVGLVPVNWTRVGSWNINEVSTVSGGGIQLDNTYTNDEGLGNKYFESDLVDISNLANFEFSAEGYADDTLDSIKIAIILSNSENPDVKYYVDKYGTVRANPITYIIDKGVFNETVAFGCKFVTNSANQYLDGVNRLQIRIYPGVKLAGGVPLRKKVRYKNLVLTGQPNVYDKEFDGKVYQYNNPALPSSKKDEQQDVYFQDNLFLAGSRYRNSMFVGNTSTLTQRWKRTGEDNDYTIVESVLIDKLSMTSRFGDIFEGAIKGYIDILSTPRIYDDRYLVLYCEYDLQDDTTELLMTELFAPDITVEYKIFDKTKDGKLIDVSDGSTSIKIETKEEFDPPPFRKTIVPHPSIPGKYLDGYFYDSDFLVTGGYVKMSQLFVNDTFRIFDEQTDGDYTTKMITENPLNIEGKGVTVRSKGVIDFVTGIASEIKSARITDGRLLVGGKEEVEAPYGVIHGHSDSVEAEPLLFLTNKESGFAISVDDANQKGRFASTVPIFADTFKWTFGDADISGLFNFEIAPISEVDAVEPNELVRFSQLASVINTVDWGQIQDHEAYKDIDDFTGWGAAFINGNGLGIGLETDLPGNTKQGYIVKFGIGNEYTDQYTLMSFGRPFGDYFDGKLYLRGIYGDQDSGWLPIGGGDVTDYQETEGEALRQKRGIKYEVETGDDFGFIGIDKIDTGIIFQIKRANFENDDIDILETRMRASDGRLVFIDQSGNEKLYAFVGEGSGGSGIPYTAIPPIRFDLSGGTTQISIPRASETTTGHLDKSDFSLFISKVGSVIADDSTPITVEDVDGVPYQRRITMSEASTSNDGYLTSEDWNEFDSKLSDGDIVENSLDFRSGVSRSKLLFSSSQSGAENYDAEMFMRYGEFPLGFNIIGKTGTNIQIESEGGNVRLIGNKIILDDSIIDTSNIASLVGGNAKFAVTDETGGIYRLTLIAD